MSLEHLIFIFERRRSTDFEKLKLRKNISWLRYKKEGKYSLLIKNSFKESVDNL